MREGLVRWWATLMLLYACDTGGSETHEAPAPPRTVVACDLGHRQGSEPFVPFGDDGELELRVGFQGFLVVTPRVRAEPSLLGRVDVTYSVRVDGEPPFGSVQPDTEVAVAGEDGVSEDIVVLLTPSDIGHFEDRMATLGVRLVADTVECTASARVRLVDHDDCIHADGDARCD